MNKSKWLIGVSLFLGCLMNACTEQTAAVKPTETSGQAPAETVGTTPIPSLTATSQITPTPTVTKTLYPTATHTLTPTSSPLDTQGPWIVIEKINSETTQQTYYVSGLSGTDWTSLNFPDPMNTIRQWKVIPSPKDGYIAFISEQTTGEQILQSYANEGKGLNLYITKLPENQLIRTIPLVGPEALEKISKEVEAQVFPVNLSVLGNKSIYRWSPDGRYLAYASAVEGVYPDIYLYDTATDSIERITQAETGAIPWDWSPDGLWLLYHQITDNEYDPMMNLPEFKAVYAYSFKTKSHFLYKVQWPEKIKWISIHTFLVYNPYECASCGSNLREGNLETGSVRQLYQDEFSGPYDAPIHQALLLNFTPNAYLSFDIESGIYRLDRNTLSLDMFLPGYYDIGYWSEELNKYVVYARTALESETSAPIFYDENGQEMFRLPETHYYPPVFYPPQPSPDGNWFSILSDDKLSIYDNQGKSVKDLAPGNAFWLRDSSGLCQIDPSEAGAIFIYERDKNWEPRLVHSLSEGGSFSDAWLIYP
jgi:hypothetical protein